MPQSVQHLCRRSLEWFTSHDLLGQYEVSGKFVKPRFSRPLFPEELRRLAHYRECVGELYADAAQWEFAFNLVSGFTRSSRGRNRTQITFPRLFGPLPIALDRLMEQLPFVFTKAGFQCDTPNLGQRELRCLASGKCKVNSLPEPYGKWQQIKQRRGRWEEDVELEVELECKLRGLPGGETTLELRMSALAIPVLEDLGKHLSIGQGRGRLPAPSVVYVLSQLHRAHGQGALGDWIRPCMQRGALQLEPATPGRTLAAGRARR
jgi:hypothetical protein